MTSEEIINVCKALGDGNRLEIIRMLCGGEMCACKVLEKFNITQPTLSHHMKILCDCGLVKIRREGKWAHYSLDKATLAAFRDFIVDLSDLVVVAGSDGECECK